MISDPILTALQFPMTEVPEIAGISAGQLKGIVDRREVVLREHNPGTGRRRMVSGGEILRIITTFAASNLGFPQKWAHQIADQVYWRAFNRTSASDLNAGRGRMSLVTYPLPDGDWANVPIWENEPKPTLPASYQLFEVDRLIDETLKKLRAVIADQPIPDALPLPEQTVGDVLGEALAKQAAEKRTPKKSGRR